MEGVDMSIFTLPEEGEENEEAGEKNSLVRFFEGVNVDLNVSLRSYLASQGSSNRQQATTRSIEEPVTDPKHTSGVPRDEDGGPVEGKSLQLNAVGLTTSASGRSDSDYTRAADESGPNLSGLKSFKRSVDSGSDSGYVVQVARGLHDLMDIIGHAQETFTRCGLNVEPLSSLNEFLTSSQSRVSQLVESFVNGKGLMKRSAKMELIKVSLQSTIKVLSSLMEIVTILLKEAMYTNHLKRELIKHQKTLLEEQEELQKAIEATKTHLSQEMDKQQWNARAGVQSLGRGLKKNTEPAVLKEISKPVHITKYIASSVPGRAEALSVVRFQQEQQKLEKLLIRKDQDAKRMQELLLHTNRELGSTKDRFAELKHQNEFLEMTMKKNLADLRQKLKTSEEEVLAKSIALKIERQKATEVGAESDRRLSELQRMSSEANGMQKAVEHLRLVVNEQRKREERLRHQLHDSQESVKALEDALKKSATNLVQRKEVERRNRQEMSKAKKITSPLADVKLPVLNKKTQPKKVTKKPVLQLPLGVGELRELAHFEDDQSASEVLHWLKKET